MSGFASLQHAFTARLTFDPVRPIGSLGRGTQLQVFNIKPGGSFKSEPGFEPAVDATFEFGSDHVTVDTDMKHCRIEVKAVLKTKEGSFISYTYLGIIEVTPAFLVLLSGSPDAKSIDFGNIFTHVTLESGAESLQSLQYDKFVGSSRFVVEPGQDPIVESKISKVVYTS